MFYLYDVPQSFYFPAVLHTGGHDIDSGGVDAAVAQNVSQPGNVFFKTIEGTSKQLAQIVWKHLAGLDPGLFAQSLHLRPNIASIQRLSASGDKNRAGTDAVFLCECQQQTAQLSRQQNGSGLTLTANGNLAAADALNGEKPQFTDPDARSADGFQNQPQPGLTFRCRQQAQILGFGQFLFLRAVDGILELQALDLAVLPALINQKPESCLCWPAWS